MSRSKFSAPLRCNGLVGLMAGSAGLALAFGAAAQTAQPVAPTSKAAPAKPAAAKNEVVVTASRVNLLGVATTASQGKVTEKEIDLRPIYRIGQLYETVPGLVVTIHSGEGKANQYLLRGFNLDHGTDFASSVDDMPINRPTNAHGQGYSDQNFIMPQILSGIDYTKGPYYAAIGDNGAVGSAHVHLTNDLPNQVVASVGTLRNQDLFAGGTQHFDADDRLWAAAEVGHVDPTGVERPQPHLDAVVGLVPTGHVGEPLGHEVGPQVAVEDVEHVPVELRGDAGGVVVGGDQAVAVLHHVGAEQERVTGVHQRGQAVEEGRALVRCEVADRAPEEHEQSRA